MITLKKQHKRYDEMTISDIGYLRSYPAQWKLERLRFAVSLNPSKTKIGLLSDSKVSFVPMEKVSDDGKIDVNEQRLFEEVKDGYTFFRNNDVLMAKITPCFENGKGCVAKNLTNNAGFGSTEFTVLSPNEDINSKFLYYLTYSIDFRMYGEVEMRGSAGQKRVPDNFVKDYWFARPKIEVQDVIATYLDQKTALLDSIIKKKQKQIELLKEKRTALINKAVTKGLDDNAEMKDSGVEWIGEIPKGWEVEKLKFVAPISNKKTSTPNKSMPYLALENVESWTGRLINLRDDAEFESIVNIFKNGDVLFGKLRPYLAKVVFVDFDGVCTGEMLVLKPNKKKILQQFLFYRMVSSEFINIVNVSAYGAKMPRASWTFIGNLEIGFPAIEEQHKIVESLERGLVDIDKLVDKLEVSIGLLQEYKTSLISNVVTGKIKV